ncbi:MAG: YicC/YloC family endoribonuclease [Syntrophomonadaceae bacterium]|nr:YicC/YloC family endoribonuclease [Bacillota bacterium]HAA09203.1 YicC family protein [Syntrophomonas sp.]HQA49401.1 YicC family protein [Syntrophomonadaceae bacterium]HQD90245.1 YicC family protein [Syntrophomonadaceae bacterium]
MANSMTGYGQAQVNRSGYQISCEVRSVNHRYLDTNIRMPRRYALLEDNIKEEIKKYVSRGRLEFTINIEKTEAKARNIKVDKDLAITYHRYLKELADDVNISPQIKIIDLFRLPEVFVLEEDVEDVEEIWPILQIALTEAMQSLVAMRNREGNYLIEDILQRTDLIADMVTELEQRSPLVAKEHTDKLRQRISELIGNELLDEARIYQEAALFAERINATEEIVRLQSHIQHLRQLLQEQNSVGRKCDFLVQEMFREINTIASKANDYEMSRIVVETKAELEKIREQLQNLE